MFCWERSDSAVAQRVSSHELKGLLSKRMQIGKEEHAFLEKDGKIIDEFENRVCKAGGIFSRSETDVIIFDISEKKLQRPLTELWTKDKKKVDVTVVLTFTITGYEAFMNHFMKNKSLVLLDDIWTDLREEFISRIIGPVVSDSKLSDLTKNKSIQKGIEVSVFRDLNPLLNNMGIILKGITATPVFSSDESMSENNEYDVEIDFNRKKDIRKTDKEEAIAEMETERIRREAEMQLEREETQNDMQEALEALELKDIKSKEKLLDQIEELKQNMSPKDEHIESTIANMEDEIEEQRLARDMAEKKFYRHEITENAFKKIADDYERKIIELQTKIEGLKRKTETQSDSK